MNVFCRVVSFLLFASLFIIFARGEGRGGEGRGGGKGIYINVRELSLNKGMNDGKEKE